MQIEQMYKQVDDGFECRVCGKNMRQKHNMKHHVETHLDTRHTCQYCNKDYKTSNSLHYHIYQAHKQQYP